MWVLFIKSMFHAVTVLLNRLRAACVCTNIALVIGACLSTGHGRHESSHRLSRRVQTIEKQARSKGVRKQNSFCKGGWKKTQCWFASTIQQLPRYLTCWLFPHPIPVTHSSECSSNVAHKSLSFHQRGSSPTLLQNKPELFASAADRGWIEVQVTYWTLLPAVLVPRTWMHSYLV